MFSTMPRIGTPTLRNIATPLIASASATSCGVVTITAPDERDLLRQRQLRVAGARGHVDDQDVELAPGDVAAGARSIAFMTIGPRQMTAASLSTRKPSDMKRTPKRSNGTDRPPDRIDLGALVDAHHERDRRAVDVRVEEPDLRAAARERRPRG